MSEFKILAKNFLDDSKTHFTYNTYDNSLKDSQDNYILEPLNRDKVTNSKYGHNYDWNNKLSPAYKSKDIRRLQISLGLSCNYSCSYCSQRLVPNVDEATLKLVPAFLNNLPNWFKGGTDGLGSEVKIEFWGGEPLVYWKTLKPLAEGIKTKYPNAKFLMISNCSLLDDEKIDWLDKLNFHIGFSHDGKSYSLTRGENPLDNKEKREAIVKLYNRLAPKGKISINPVLNKFNKSRFEIIDYLKNLFNINTLVLGEGKLLDVYDDKSLELSITSQEEKYQYRINSLKEYILNKSDKFYLWQEYQNNFLKVFERSDNQNYLKQNSVIDNPHYLCVTLRGNVLTSQNVSEISKNSFGQSHVAGNVNDFDNIKVKTISTWKNKKNCKECPVVNLCDVSSFYGEGKYFEQTCDNVFNDHVVGLSISIFHLTGFIPYFIEGNFREDRKNIFGLNN